MKSFSITAIVLLAVSTAIPSLAAPVPTESEELDLFERAFDDWYANILEARGKKGVVATTYKDAVDWLADPTNKPHITGNICFWSGRTPGAPGVGSSKAPAAAVTYKASTQVDAFAHHAKCTSIFDLMPLAGFKARIPNFSTPEWEEVSEALAKHMEGTATVLLGTDVAHNSVWLKKELPELMANKKVVHIEKYDLTNTGAFAKGKNIK